MRDSGALFGMDLGYRRILFRNISGQAQALSGDQPEENRGGIFRRHYCRYCGNDRFRPDLPPDYRRTRPLSLADIRCHPLRCHQRAGRPECFGAEAAAGTERLWQHHAWSRWCIDVLEQNYNQEIDVDNLAKEVNLSVSSFYRLFKDVTSDTPVQYLKKIRLNKAKEMIITQNAKAYVAALEVGYQSVSQFSREFKRYFGVTPAALKVS